jgi:hypothetical protein
MRINLIGGSLYSVILAKKLKYIYPKIEINIVEQAPQILSTWTSKCIGDFKLNNGFHAIEMPRSAELVKFLLDLSDNIKFISIKNEKKILINRTVASFTDSFPAWPSSITDLMPTLDHVQRLGWIEALRHSPIYKLVQACSIRYGDNPDEFLGRFYPWFFPVEYNFLAGDEGNDFQNKVRKKLIINKYYLQPIGKLFESMIEPLQISLKASGINLALDSHFSLSDSHHVTNSRSKQITFWTSSTANLYKQLENKTLKIKNKRYLHNVLFRVGAPEYEFSEILIMDEEVPYASRLSLYSIKPDQNFLIVQLEYISEKDYIGEKDLRKVLKLLSDVFPDKIEYLGQCLGRPIFGISDSIISEYELLIKSRLASRSIDIDEFIINKYWYPINMNKCYTFACADTGKYCDIINRYL